jgi:hypothetical protein
MIAPFRIYHHGYDSILSFLFYMCHLTNMGIYDISISDTKTLMLGISREKEPSSIYIDRILMYSNVYVGHNSASLGYNETGKVMNSIDGLNARKIYDNGAGEVYLSTWLCIVRTPSDIIIADKLYIKNNIRNRGNNVYIIGNDKSILISNRVEDILPLISWMYTV